MEHQVPDTQGVIRANIISTGGTCARAGHTLKMVLTVVVLIDNIDLASNDLLTNTTAMSNYLKVFFTNWLIFECEKPLSYNFSANVTLHAAGVIELLVAADVVLHDLVLADPADLQPLLVTLGAARRLVSDKEDLAESH